EGRRRDGRGGGFGEVLLLLDVTGGGAEAEDFAVEAEGVELLAVERGRRSGAFVVGLDGAQAQGGVGAGPDRVAGVGVEADDGVLPAAGAQSPKAVAADDRAREA